MAKQDTLYSVGDRFNLVPSTVMKIVNVMLYIVSGMKTDLICWPKTPEEFQYIKNWFKNYPAAELRTIYNLSIEI